MFGKVDSNHPSLMMVFYRTPAPDSAATDRRRKRQRYRKFISPYLLHWLIVAVALSSANSFSVPQATLPKHVAFVCDGNTRWATQRGLPAAAGHAAGADRLVHLVEHLAERGIPYCTLYGFSTENWKRSPVEVKALMRIIEDSAIKLYDQALREGVRVRLIGDWKDSRIPASLQKALERLQHDTHQYEDSRLTVCLAINYGGRADIVEANRRIAELAKLGEVSPSDITEEFFSSSLSTVGLPDPDMIIRTSGESRLSNFLLWNAAYSELYFTDVYWPDFDKECLNKALQWFASRKRRFGSHASLDSVSRCS